jgi:hypothetical protein
MPIFAFFGVLIFFTVVCHWLGVAGLTTFGLILNFLSLPVAIFIAYRTWRYRKGIKCPECGGAGKWINEQRTGYVQCLACDGVGRVKPDSFWGVGRKNTNAPFVNGPEGQGAPPSGDDYGRHGY